MNAVEQQPKTRRPPRPPRTPKGRQIDPAALDEVRALLADRPRRRDLLIEHLHLIQDRYGHLSAAHLAALAAEMKLAQTEVYEVATFYAHFDVVKDGPPPPAITVRVCDRLSCAMAGAEQLLSEIAGDTRRRCARGARALHGRLRPRAGRRGRPCADDAGDGRHSCRRRRKRNKHAHAWHPGADFAAYQQSRRLRAAEGLPRRQAHPRRRDQDRERRRPARARRRRISRPGANGSWCAPNPRRACSPSTATKASPAPSRTAIISSAIRTVSSRAC